jgi:hypothetical protein
MSEPPLPEDLSRWPQNPYDLLGVSANSPPRDVRRAYTGLIRTYKPEQFPEHFRRIREAYEAVVRRTELFSPREDLPPDQPPPAAREKAIPHDKAAPPRRLPTRPLEEELAVLWQWAVAGQEETAYGRLLRLQAQHPGSAAVYLRLYWLLTVAPRLDAGRCPNDWLVQGLLASGAPGPLRQLYRDVVADDPAEAWTERYARLLADDARPAQLADLVEWRWRAGAWLERWDLLMADLCDCRPRLRPAQEDLWLRLLFVLADEVAWYEDAAAEELMDACLNEIHQHDHLAFRNAAAFDRLDFLLAVSRGCRKLRRRTVPLSFLRLIARSWTQPFAAVRPHLESVLERINASPTKWLECFTLVQHGAPPCSRSSAGSLTTSRPPRAAPRSMPPRPRNRRTR